MKLIGTTYTNKMHIIFDSLSLKNSTAKRAWFVVMGWELFWEVYQKACDLRQSMLKSLMFIYGAMNDLESSQPVSELVVEVLKMATYEGFWATSMLSEMSPCEVS